MQLIGFKDRKVRSVKTPLGVYLDGHYSFKISDISGQIEATVKTGTSAGETTVIPYQCGPEVTFYDKERAQAT